MKNQLEDLANTFADFDPNWWPFLYLRPKKYERLGLGRTALLALLYGTLTGFGANIISALAEEPLPFESAASLPSIFVALFLLMLQAIAWAWNRRALRMARSAGWSKKLQLAAMASLPAEQTKREREADHAPEAEDYDL